jgi:hypothetical protein
MKEQITTTKTQFLKFVSEASKGASKAKDRETANMLTKDALERFDEKFGGMTKPTPKDSFRHHQEYEQEQAFKAFLATELERAKREAYSEVSQFLEEQDSCPVPLLLAFSDKFFPNPIQ